MLALAGLPVFSGFLSKDAILTGTMGWASVARAKWGILAWLIPLAGFATAIMTPIYMGRQLFLVFFGTNRLYNQASYRALREVPMLMRLPLAVLAILSLGIWYGLEPFNFMGAWPMQLLEIPQAALPRTVEALSAGNRLLQIKAASLYFATFTGIASALLVFAGLGLSYLIYHLFNNRGAFYTNHFVFRSHVMRLSYSNWHLDAIYRRTVIAFGLNLMRFSSWLDRRVIDRFLDLLGVVVVVLSHVLHWIDRTFVDGVLHAGVWVAGRAGQANRSLQGGQVQQYLLVMLVGLLAVLLWMFV
jgi:NADH-quinone oxidoreductase subunit L